LCKEIIPGYRTLARLAWHIVQTPGEMAGRCGLEIAGPSTEEGVPQDSALIIQAWLKVYRSVAEKWGKIGAMKY